jgi:uncharacterized protein
VKISLKVSTSLGMTRLLVAFIALFASALSPLAAETLPSKPDGYFNDYAGVVDRPTALQLSEQLAQFERETSTQIVVAIYRTMQSESSIDDYTRRIAKTWDIGQKDTQNGAALFVFVDNHQMFIQTAHGLEGALPDATCFDITHNVIAPFFKQNDYAGGLKAGINAMMQVVRGEYKGTGRTQKEQGRQGGMPVGFIIFLIVVIFIIVASRSARRRGYGYSGVGGPFIGGFGGGGWSGGGGGSSGGGFSGFSGGGGGGGFGGGGAGSSW